MDYADKTEHNMSPWPLEVECEHYQDVYMATSMDEFLKMAKIYCSVSIRRNVFSSSVI